MPFATTSTPPKINAKVTIKFAGLMLLKPGANNTCEIGIHRLSDTHSFQAMVIVNKPHRTPSVIRLVSGPLTRPFAINVSDSRAGVRAFERTTGPLVRSRHTNHRLDFRWALDMQDIQGIDLDFTDDARPVATLNAGVLYTSTLIREELNVDLVRGRTRTPLHRFSADLAAAITLPNGGKVDLSWDEGGEPREFRLPRRADALEPKTTYTVYLLNDPSISTAEVHDELDHYYQVLQHNGALIPEPSRFSMEFSTGTTTDEIPCMPVIINS